MLKATLLKVFNKFLKHKEVKSTLFDLINSKIELPPINNVNNPYYKIGLKEQVCERDDIIFITSRFRTGSTVLWNFFRQLEGTTAYYEPFNERRWFDKSHRGSNTDSSHQGVNNYWEEYNDLEVLGNLYREDWINKNLMMDATSWQPDMKRYIETIVDKSESRSVLQFNRIDFRLPWVRQHFPKSKLIHLYRNPRDQWCSFLTDKELMNSKDVEETYKDSFYLDVWCEDLKTYFPFLDPKVTKHPYQRFYYIWKLSYIFGLKYSDMSFSYEDFTNNFDKLSSELAKLLDVPEPMLWSAHTVVNSGQLDKWKKYADEEWFFQHEKICEQTLHDFLKRD